jgi:hypothetical protein
MAVCFEKMAGRFEKKKKKMAVGMKGGGRFEKRRWREI